MGTQARGKQQAFATGADGESNLSVRERPRERKVIYLWLPRQYVSARGVNVQGFVADVNSKITGRGFVTYDGQILRTPITDITVDAGFIEAERRTPFSGLVRVGRDTEVVVEGDGNDAYDPPPPRPWGRVQTELFGLANPYQMSEDADRYTTVNLGTSVCEAYLLPGEMIAAIVHGVSEDHYFYCECHSAEVVYTTRHRLVCMACGRMHLALRAPVSVEPKRLLSAEEWFHYFDEKGELRYEEVDVAIIDFSVVENAETIWVADSWETAKHQFIFFARSSPEEIEAAVRGTEADPSIFLEAGWERMETQLPPVEQLAHDSVDVGLIENAGHAARDGVVCFLRSHSEASFLVNAIPHLFRALELLLKAKLERLDARALSNRPDNPEVLDRLAARGIVITARERGCIDRLRRLRNQLQHGAAKFNYRTGLAVARQAIIFIDRFALQEVNSWLGDVVAPEDRLDLFEIQELAANARAVTKSRIEYVRVLSTVEITTCLTCGEHAVVRKYPSSGAVCYYCGHPPPSMPASTAS